MNYPCPPVLIVGFNRPDCLRQVLDSVRQARPSQLFLALDYPRANRQDDVLGWEGCKRVFESVDWPCDVHRNYAEKNMGCRWRMGSAITWAFNNVDRLIILEDDCVASKSFYRFCNEILERYQNNDRIGGVCGYLEHWRLIGKLRKIADDYYFDRLNTCCGWATWKRAWDCFDPYMADWPSLKMKGILKKICQNKYEERIMAEKFQDVYDGKKSSWATAWALSALKNDFLFVHSTVSLIKNIGFGAGATHSEGCSDWGRINSEDLRFPIKHPSQVACNNYVERKVVRWMYVPSRLRRWAYLIKRLIIKGGQKRATNRTKVLWLCTYGNDDKWSRISRWYPLNKTTYGLWIPDLLRGLENDNDYEISVASFTVFQKKSIVNWQKNGINYFSYQKGLPVVGATLPIIDLVFNHLFNRIRIRRIVRRVKPDIIHLFGAENPEYSSVIPILARKYRIVQTIQGFKTRDPDVGEQKGFVRDIMERRRCRNEIRVLNVGRKFICEQDAANYLQTVRKNPFEYRLAYFPINEALVAKVLSEGVVKKYDFVFLSRLVLAKGIFDFIKIVGLIKSRNPDSRFAVAGPAMSKADFEQSCRDVRVPPSSVDFFGKLPSQYDVYKLMSQSKVYLCPTYNDSFPTTIREAMSLGTAVVAYRTGGIPYVNEEEEDPYVELVEQGDFAGMAEKAQAIVSNPEKLSSMIRRGQERAKERFSLDSHIRTLKQVYNEVKKENNDAL